MKLELVPPFVNSAFAVLETLLDSAPSRKEVRLENEGSSSSQVNIAIGVTGDAKGCILFGMSLETAEAIASKMIGQAVESFDQLAASAIGELCNMIAGNGLLHLSQIGFQCDLTPPTIVRGSEMTIDTLAIPGLIIPFDTGQGEFTITLMLIK